MVTLSSSTWIRLSLKYGKQPFNTIMSRSALNKTLPYHSFQLRFQ